MKNKIEADKKIEFIKSQLSFLSKYYNKKKSFDNLQVQLDELKEFNAFLHRVIDTKEHEVKRYEGYKRKYENLKKGVPNKIASGSDKYGRSLNKSFYFPFV